MTAKPPTLAGQAFIFRTFGAVVWRFTPDTSEASDMVCMLKSKEVSEAVPDSGHHTVGLVKPSASLQRHGQQSSTPTKLAVLSHLCAHSARGVNSRGSGGRLCPLYRSRRYLAQSKGASTSQIKNPTMMGHLDSARAMQRSLYSGLRAEIRPHCNRENFMDWYRCASPELSSATRRLLSKLGRGSTLRSKQLTSLQAKLGVTTVILYSMAIKFHDQRSLDISVSSIDLSTGASNATLRFAVPYLKDQYNRNVWPGVAKAFAIAIRDGSTCDFDDLENDTLVSAPDWLGSAAK